MNRKQFSIKRKSYLMKRQNMQKMMWVVIAKCMIRLMT